jgi:threonylcarbamoyladenosine tRNA methylthiotransferase MtaB
MSKSLCESEAEMRVRFYTLGCKVNQYETQAIGRIFEDAGFSLVHSGSADVLVVNSCTVTAAADKKTRQLVRRLRRENPFGIIVLTGCLPQAAGSDCNLPQADIITGTSDKKGLVNLVEKRLENYDGKTGDRTSWTGVTALDDIPFEELTLKRFDDSFQRAYIKIEDGCDRQCSYCIIPKARGPVRSCALEFVSKQAACFVNEGYREIVLTGVNLSRFGSDCNLRLADAVEACHLAGDFRIRLGSLEPDLVCEEDFRRFASMDKLCAHFHLALQSGCDETLSRMNRPYTTGHFEKVVETARAYMPHASVTTDLIVGFPGETDEEFEKTCCFVRRMRFLRAHVFEFSARPGTPAAAMQGQIPPEVKRERAKVLGEISRNSQQQYAAAQVGKTTRVLLEASGGGYNDQYLFVRVPKHSAVGEFVEVLLVKASNGQCEGRLKTVEKISSKG